MMRQSVTSPIICSNQDRRTEADRSKNDGSAKTMNRQESDREDLMREAIALSQRMEVRCDGFNDIVTLGFRNADALSIFIGQDPVYQFDPDARLRRAFVDGLLYRSQHDTLAQLTRQRTEGRTVLARVDLAAPDLAAFRNTMNQRLTGLLAEIGTVGQTDTRCEILRSVGDPEAILVRVMHVLNQVLADRPDWLSCLIRARK